MEKHKGRIVDVSQGRGGFQRIVQGIKKDKQPYYDQNFYGSNGTYAGQDETYPALLVKVSVYDFDNRAVEIDIRDIVLKHFGRQRMSPNLVSEVREKLLHKKVNVIDASADSDYKIENINSML